MDDLRTRFAEHGYVRLERAFSTELAATMADAVWVELGPSARYLASGPFHVDGG